MAKLSAAMRELRNFLTNEAMMSKDKAGQYVRDLKKVNGFDDSAADKLTSHLRDKLDASFQGQSHDDPDSLKQFLSVNNLGGEIWQRGQRYGDFFDQWTNRNFGQYNDLDRYNEYYNETLRKAFNGKKVDYDDISYRLQQDAIKKAELDRSEHERLASIGNRQKEALEKEQREREKRQEIDRDRQQAIDRNRQNLALIANANPNDDLVIATANHMLQQNPTMYTFLLEKNARPLRQAAEQRQAAIDNANKNIADSQKILDEYENRLKEQGANSDVIQESFDTFNYLDQLAKFTDEQIAAQTAQTGLDVKNGIEIMKAARTFAQNPTDEKTIADYVKTMQDKGLKGYDIESQTHIGKAYAAHVRLKQAQEDLEKIGSGKSLQETAGSAQEAAVADAAADFSGVLPTYEQAMAGNGKVSLDRAMLRERMKGDPSSWGFDAAAEHLAKEQDTYLGKRIEEIKKSKASDAEKRKMFDDAIATVQKNVAEGPGMSNYFFGNQLHTGAVGAAAIVGTMGVAFGGRKSNAELYSSPF